MKPPILRPGISGIALVAVELVRGMVLPCGMLLLDGLRQAAFAQQVTAFGRRNSSIVPIEIAPRVLQAKVVDSGIVLISGNGQLSLIGNVAGWSRVPDGIGPALSIDVGTSHALVLRSDQTVACWGGNEFGQCSPPSSQGVCMVAAGGDFSLAVTSTGNVLAWGDNRDRQGIARMVVRATARLGGA